MVSRADKSRKWSLTRMSISSTRQVCVSVCLSDCLPILSACLPACLTTCLPACLSVCLSVCLYCLPAYTVCLPACLPVCLPVCLPACLSVCLSLWRPSNTQAARQGRICSDNSQVTLAIPFHLNTVAPNSGPIPPGVRLGSQYSSGLYVTGTWYDYTGSDARTSRSVGGRLYH